MSNVNWPGNTDPLGDTPPVRHGADILSSVSILGPFDNRGNRFSMIEVFKDAFCVRSRRKLGNIVCKA